MSDSTPEQLAVAGLAGRIDTTVPHPARRYDYLLGGKDNFAADRASAEEMLAVYPAARIAAVENRRFLRRAVAYLAREAGVRQFLDIGTGIPSVNNTHEVAQSIEPTARVVYVDNDPIVLVHARALLTGHPRGRTAYIDADLREPRKILDHPDLLATLDLDQPVALMLIAILHFIEDAEDPYGIVEQLVSALPAGSYLAMSHFTTDFMPPELAERITATWRANPSNGPGQARSAAEIGRFFAGLKLVPPGLVPTSQWRAEDEPQPRPTTADVSCYGVIGRKA